jgi:nicotinamide phosphoribosyltransferase
MKATYAVVNGEERLLFKDPVTDNGTKKSQRGLVAVVEAYGQPRLVDGLDKKSYEETYKDIDLLEVVFEDGKLLRDESLSEIREMLSKNL